MAVGPAAVLDMGQQVNIGIGIVVEDALARPLSQATSGPRIRPGNIARPRSNPTQAAPATALAALLR